jgi:colanic acid/amylovoran biosynthesis glycosyltransferase
MKIIYVTASLPYGTTEIFAIPEIRELVSRGHEVRLVPMSLYSKTPHSDAAPFVSQTFYRPLLSAPVVLSGLKEFVRHPGRVQSVLSRLTQGQPRGIVKKNRGVLARSLWLAHFARHWGADHIHAYWASVAASSAMIAGEVSSIPWSFTAHRWDITTPNALRAKVESARFVRFISEDGLELARAEGGPTLAQRASIIRMGVPLTNSEIHRTEPPAGTHLRLVCAGSLIPRKGQRFLIEAVARLAAEGIHVSVDLAGEGNTRPELLAQAARLGIAERVTLRGNVDHAELLESYSAGRYDAFILPSLHEGISVALIEAMSRQLPAIATDVGGTRELLTDGAGLLISAEDVSSIVEAVRKLALDKHLRLELARTGQKRVMDEYDIVGIVDTLEARFRGDPHASTLRTKDPAL